MNNNNALQTEGTIYTSFRIKVTMRRKMEEIAEKRQTQLSSIIRLAVAEYLERQEHVK